MSSGGPGDADANDGASTPWERPRRWAQDRPDSPRVEDLLARLSPSGPGTGSRRRRAADEAVAAGDLIAAFSDDRDPEEGTPDARAEPGGDAEPSGEAVASTHPHPDGDAEPIPYAGPGGDAVAGAAPQPDGDAEHGGGVEPVADAAPGSDAEETVVLPVVPDPGAPWVAGATEAAGTEPGSPWESVLASLQRQSGSPDAIAGPAAGAGDPPGGGSGGVRTPPPGGEPPGHADHPHHRWLIAGRTMVALFAVVLLLAAGTEWVIKARADAVLADRQVSALAPNDTNISTPTVTGTGGHRGTNAVRPSGTDANRTYQAENILLMGSDTRDTKEDVKLGGAGTTTMQSDVLMVAHISADRSHVTVVSIPRDLWVTAPTCKAWDYTTNTLSDKDYPNQYSEWKITNAYSVGGPQCTVRAVQKLTGLRINRVIIIDFSGFKSMVDAMGGITVNICRPIIDSNLGTVMAKAGTQHINGTQALTLVRARHVYGDTRSDLARIHRQQMVLSTLLRQATSAGVLLNPATLNSLLQAFVHNVRTDNVTLDDLLNIAQSLGDLNPQHVTFYTLPTVPGTGEGLDQAPNAPLIWSALVNDRPLPGEVTAPATTRTTPSTSTAPTAPTAPSSGASTTPAAPQLISVAPGDVDIEVVNVAGRGGVATGAMDKLTPLGFDVTESNLLLIPGDVRSGITVEYSDPNRAAALTVAAAVPGATLVRTAGLGQKVRLMLGSSFDGTVQSVTVGSPVPESLSTSPSPASSDTGSTTGPASSTPAPGGTTSTPGTVRSLTNVESVNAGNAACI